jgi:hypothetical protein
LAPDVKQVSIIMPFGFGGLQSASVVQYSGVDTVDTVVVEALDKQYDG